MVSNPSQIEVAAESGDPTGIVDEMLASAGFKGGQLSGYDPVSGGNPVMSQLFRVRLTGADGIPPSAIVKIPSRELSDRRREANSGCYAREMNVYSLLQHMQGGFQPRIWASAYDPDSGLSALLMEDLGPPPSRRSFDNDLIRRTLEYLAEIHSRFWGDDSLGSERWARSGYRADIFIEDPAQFAPNWNVLAPSPILHPHNTDSVNQVAEYLTGNLIQVLDALERRPKTLIHGDLHVANMMLRETGNGHEPVLIDWQEATYSGSSSDVAKFLATTLTPQAAAEHFEDLVAVYHSALRPDIRTHYSMGTFRHDITLALLGTFANYVICATLEVPDVERAMTVNRSLKSVARTIDKVRLLDWL